MKERYKKMLMNEGWQTKRLQFSPKVVVSRIYTADEGHDFPSDGGTAVGDEGPRGDCIASSGRSPLFSLARPCG